MLTTEDLNSLVEDVKTKLTIKKYVDSPNKLYMVESSTKINVIFGHVKSVFN